MLRFSFKLTLISVALAVLAVSAASALLPPSGDYEPSNPCWNGLEAFTRAVNATPVDSASSPLVAENSVLFIIGPSANFTGTQVEAVKAFLQNRGTLVLMDETGAINPLLADLGLSVSVDGHYMLDPVFYYGSWKLPKIINVKGGNITSGVEAIALDLPSVLNVKDSSLKVLAYSSSFSFLDLDGDFKPSSGEPAGPFIVAAEATYGRGRILIFADSSLFLNSVLNLGDNYRLLHNIADGHKVYVDVGVWPASPQQICRNAVVDVYRVLSAPEFKYSLALATVTVIYAVMHNEKPSPTPDESDALVGRHPGWDRRLLEALKEARSRIVQPRD